MENEIIIGDTKPGTVGNCYIGSIASKAIFDKTMQSNLEDIRTILERGDGWNKAWCYEYVHGKFILRAAQSTIKGAMHYMNENSVLIHA